MPNNKTYMPVSVVGLTTDAAYNMQLGTAYLHDLLDRFGGALPLAIAAYNAGTRSVDSAGGIPPIPETRQYLARVLRYRLGYLREGAAVLALRR